MPQAGKGKQQHIFSPLNESSLSKCNPTHPYIVKVTSHNINEWNTSSHKVIFHNKMLVYVTIQMELEDYRLN